MNVGKIQQKKSIFIYKNPYEFQFQFADKSLDRPRDSIVNFNLFFSFYLLRNSNKIHIFLNNNLYTKL